MKQSERVEWIIHHLTRKGFADILDAEFVDRYIEITNSSFKPVQWGAHKCPQLAKDLRKAYDSGLVERSIMGLSGGAWQPGFPKWVYSYSLTDLGRDLAEEDIDEFITTS